MKLLSRQEAEIVLMKEGLPFKLGNLSIHGTNETSLIVTGWTSYIHLSSLTQQIAKEELADIKKRFEDLIFSNFDLANYVKGRNVIYTLFYDDSGKVSIEICNELTGQINWTMKLKP